jgi:transmembrane sensor
MNYKDFQVEDFLKDEYFVNWVKNPGAESSYFWNNWRKQNPDKSAIIERASRFVQSVDHPQHMPSEKDTNEVLEKILNHIDKHDVKTESRKLYQNIFYKAAAVILVVMSFYFVVDRISFSDNTVIDEVVINEIEKATEKGQKLNFELPDGTRIKLNAESRLIVSADFGQGQRMVTLQGEAFFNVAKDPSQPFIIKTGEVQTRVLGTAFNINAYENEQIRVAVETGLVEISKSGSDEPSLLATEQMLTYNREERSITVSTYNKVEVLGWKDNLIYFKDADFKEIQTTLERWYGVEFTFMNGVSPSRIKEIFTGTFQNQSLERVLGALNYTSNYEYELLNNKVYVKIK